MRKLLPAAFVALACVALNSCGGASKEAADNSAADEVAAAGPAAQADDKVVDLTDSDFKVKVADYSTDPTVYVGTEPCIVDFWATWCGPCVALSPVLHEISKTTGITVYKVDVDNAPAIAEAYGIQTIPALFLCKDGKVAPYTGDRSDADLLATAQSLLK